MADTVASQQTLNSSLLHRIRRNHGLEHATLHMLADRLPHHAIGGYSDPWGFWIIGNIPTETIADAVNEAVRRIKGGERQLAIHPNCGTNFLVGGILAGLAGALAMVGSGKRPKDKLERLPLAISLATLALMAAQPLGLLVQSEITTSGDPGNLECIEVTCRQQGLLTVHRVRVWG